MKSCYLLVLLPCLTLAGSISPQKTLHDGNSQFTARMFNEVVKMNPGRSMVLSAFSVITPLSQLAVGSEGPSHDEILNAIGFPDDATTNEVFSYVDKKFSSVEGVEFKKASKFYIPVGYQVQETFATLSRDVYHSEIANINFGDSENAAKEINTWVEDQTNHRIRDIVDSNALTADTRGVLVNAIYFKGSWKYPFSNYTTRSENFYLSKEKSFEVQMMHNTEEYKYKESEVLNSKILEMPYQGDESSFIIILPNDVEGLGKVLEKLRDPNILDQETSDMTYVEVRASIPKFKIETTTNLKEVLKNMNVTKMFSPAANLNKLLKSDEILFISDALQKAFIEVNEEGVEAAAANVFDIVAPSAIRPSFNFIADHPFAYFLKVQDEVIFNGVFYGS